MNHNITWAFLSRLSSFIKEENSKSNLESASFLLETLEADGWQALHLGSKVFLHLKELLRYITIYC